MFKQEYVFSVILAKCLKKKNNWRSVPKNNEKIVRNLGIEPAHR